MKRKIILFFTIVILTVFLMIKVSKAIKIEEIECKNQYGECSINILAELETVKGQDVRLAKRNLESYLQGQNAIETYLISYKIPNILKIELIEKKPFVAFSDIDGSLLYLDKEAKLLSATNETGLPVVVNRSDKKYDELDKGSIIFAAQLLSDLYYLYQTDQIELKNDQIISSFLTQNKVIFPINGDEKVLVGAFRLIYQQLNTSDQTSNIDNIGKPYVVDLRYKNPVIRAL